MIKNLVLVVLFLVSFGSAGDAQVIVHLDVEDVNDVPMLVDWGNQAKLLIERRHQRIAKLIPAAPLRDIRLAHRRIGRDVPKSRYRRGFLPLLHKSVGNKLQGFFLNIRNSGPKTTFYIFGVFFPRKAPRLDYNVRVIVR